MNWSLSGAEQEQEEEDCMANILVCDDERYPSAKCLTSPFATKRYRVETVQAGQLAKNKIDGALYDVIITDIKMPNTSTASKCCATHTGFRPIPPSS